MTRRLLNEAVFLEVFCDYFHLDSRKMLMESRLVEDLGFDSVMMVEVLMFLEDLSSEDVPESMASGLITARDVYHYYERRSNTSD